MRPRFPLPARRRALTLWLALALTAGLALGVALGFGSSRLSPAEIVSALSGGGGVAGEVVLNLRLPRALAAFAAGGLLALSGALMQVLLRNPLADPYVLGVSGGAAVGALGAMTLGFEPPLVDLGAAGGALFSAALVFGLARRAFARFTAVEASPQLLLVGVVTASGWGALILLILALAPDAALRGMLFWLVGDLGGADSYLPGFAALAAALLWIYPQARRLNVLLRGDLTAQALGVRVAALRRSVFVVASLATAIAVTIAGPIGFVGLVVPHGVRLLVGNDQRMLLPASALGGGALLVLADTLARTVAAPLQLPVGVVTALLGVPAFLFLLTRRAR